MTNTTTTYKHLEKYNFVQIKHEGRKMEYKMLRLNHNSFRTEKIMAENHTSN